VIPVEVITDTLSRYRPVLVEPLDGHAAVALIVDTVRSTQDPDIVFIQRAAHEGDPWSGHVAFPGGRCEPEDDGPSATAVRETREEIGIDLSTARMLGRLDDLQGRRSHQLIVSCFVYIVNGTGPFQLNYEVADALALPMSGLLDPSRWTEVSYQAWGGMLFPGINLGEDDQRVIWGLTYRFLERFFGILGHTLPAS